MMVVLHLFCRLDEGVFSPLLFIRGVPLTYYFGLFCDSCVCLFAMCSGYGIAQKNKLGKPQKSNLIALGRLLIVYETVLLLFCAVCLCSGNARYLVDAKTFLFHVFPLLHDYNGAWWYLLTYILLIVSVPLIRAVFQRARVITMLLSAGLFVVTHFLKEMTFPLGTIPNYIAHQAIMYFNTLFPFLIGYFFAETTCLEKISALFDKIKKPYRILLSVFFVLAAASLHALFPSSIVAPATGTLMFILFPLVFETIRGIKIVFNYLGKHSTGIWLCHMFFWQGRYGAFVYKAKYALPILLLMLLLSIGSSYIVSFVSRPILSLYDRKVKKKT